MGGGGYPCCCQQLFGSTFQGSTETFPTVTCLCCLNSTGPLRWQITVSGIFVHDPFGAGACLDCADLNGVYVLDYEWSSSQHCVWSLNFPAVCGYDRAVYTLSCGGFPAPFVNIELRLIATDESSEPLVFTGVGSGGILDCFVCHTLTSEPSVTACATRDPSNPLSPALAEVCPLSFGDECQIQCCGDTALPGTVQVQVDMDPGGCIACTPATDIYTLAFNANPFQICEGGTGGTHTSTCKWTRFSVDACPNAVWMVLEMTCTATDITLDLYIYSGCLGGVPLYGVHYQGTTPAGDCAFAGVVLNHVSTDDPFGCVPLPGATATVTAV